MEDTCSSFLLRNKDRNSGNFKTTGADREKRKKAMFERAQPMDTDLIPVHQPIPEIPRPRATPNHDIPEPRTLPDIHPCLANLPPAYFERYWRIKDVPPASSLACLDLDSLEEHNTEWSDNLHHCLAEAGLLALSTAGFAYPLVALQEFWSSFEWDTHKSRQHLKCITFRLGGMHHEASFDDLAELLAIHPNHYSHGTHGWDNNSSTTHPPYPDIWRHITGRLNANLRQPTIGQISHPLFRFLHYLWRQSLCYAIEDRRTRHHVSREELQLFRAVYEGHRLHPGWCLARFFHKRTTTKKLPIELPGGPFVARLITRLRLNANWGPEVPRIRIGYVGVDIAQKYGLNLSITPTTYVRAGAPPRQDPQEDEPPQPQTFDFGEPQHGTPQMPPPQPQFTDQYGQMLTQMQQWQTDFSSGSHQWQKDMVAYVEDLTTWREQQDSWRADQDARWIVTERQHKLQQTWHDEEVAWRREFRTHFHMPPPPDPAQ